MVFITITNVRIDANLDIDSDDDSDDDSEIDSDFDIDIDSDAYDEGIMSRLPRFELICLEEMDEELVLKLRIFYQINMIITKLIGERYFSTPYYYKFINKWTFTRTSRCVFPYCNDPLLSIQDRQRADSITVRFEWYQEAYQRGYKVEIFCKNS